MGRKLGRSRLLSLAVRVPDQFKSVLGPLDRSASDARVVRVGSLYALHGSDPGSCICISSSRSRSGSGPGPGPGPGSGPRSTNSGPHSTLASHFDSALVAQGWKCNYASVHASYALAKRDAVFVLALEFGAKARAHVDFELLNLHARKRPRHHMSIRASIIPDCKGCARRVGSHSRECHVPEIVHVHQGSVGQRNNAQD